MIEREMQDYKLQTGVLNLKNLFTIGTGLLIALYRLLLPV